MDTDTSFIYVEHEDEFFIDLLGNCLYDINDVHEMRYYKKNQHELIQAMKHLMVYLKLKYNVDFFQYSNTTTKKNASYDCEVNIDWFCFSFDSEREKSNVYNYWTHRNDLVIAFDSGVNGVCQMRIHFPVLLESKVNDYYCDLDNLRLIVRDESEYVNAIKEIIKAI